LQLPEDELPPTNSGAHEGHISDFAKDMVLPFLHISLRAGAIVKEMIAANAADPLAIERWLHLADRASEVAHRCYTIGDEAHTNALEAYRREP